MSNPMYVYTVTATYKGEFCVEGVFASKEKALQWANTINEEYEDDDPNRAVVEVYEVRQ